MKLYNTLTRQKDEVKPLHDNIIKMYTCGLTVYGQPHIGNWVGYIYWDVLQRTLEASGYTVERTQNITDVGHLTSDDDNGEDKMEKGARALKMTAWDVAQKFIDIADHEAYDLLKLKRPTHLVRATSLINEQIEFVKKLEEQGYTYEIPGDGIYFDTSKLSNYGHLARLDIKGLEAGARVSVEGKKNITDFAVWKFSPTNEKRDMEWDSPWGKGFPGWHLECSVIARETLGDQIDIHCGGIDHIPVHHTNEIAQTESVTHEQFSTLWVHNNHIKVDGTKMSKSLGNIYTLKDITQNGYDLMAFKLFVMMKNYETEGNFTWDNLKKANSILLDIQNAYLLISQKPNEDSSLDKSYFDMAYGHIRNRLNDNLNTPLVIVKLQEVAKSIRMNGVSRENEQYAVEFYKSVDNILGLDISIKANDVSKIELLLSEYEIEYKNAKEQFAKTKESAVFAKTDLLRHKIEALGYTINIGPDSSITYAAKMRANLTN